METKMQIRTALPEQICFCVAMLVAVSELGLYHLEIGPWHQLSVWSFALIDSFLRFRPKALGATSARLIGTNWGMERLISE